MKDEPVMKDIVERSAGNAQYCSKRIQNELIDIFGQLITKKILDQVKSADFFNILANEATNMSREEFIEFAVVEVLRGESLGQFILSRIEKLGVEMTLCRGQGYEGAPNMSGHLPGVQVFISSKYPLAKLRFKV
ncbi:hypothetical protein QYM36_017463 [Artemia franciscana]|uniref:DUF4371 domain-containing protein n=1 Tax=Artemia franciscana TaxID=6661 RepID=A0AA88L1J5_ARTSF|nr:hypothetical protein QYM36_017463 [Artemia franciscana]